MRDVGCLIIDDVEASLSRTTALGREVLNRSACSVRKAVLDFAKRRGWTVVRHERYAAWASELMASEPRPWIVLDPLFPRCDNDTNVIHRRYSRSASLVDGMASRPALSETRPLPNAEVGLIDDAASSGFTVSQVWTDLRAAGSAVVHVALCASSRSARERLRGRLAVRWSQFVPGDWRVIHLRDGCPYLPFSGRRLASPATTEGGNPGLVLSVPPTVVEGTLWHVLWLNPVTAPRHHRSKSRSGAEPHRCCRPNGQHG